MYALACHSKQGMWSPAVAKVFGVFLGNLSNSTLTAASRAAWRQDNTTVDEKLGLSDPLFCVCVFFLWQKGSMAGTWQDFLYQEDYNAT